METTLLEVASKIGTPLALAGFSIAILYLIYKALLGSGLLSTVSGGHTFRVLNRMLTFVFVLALVALILGVSAYLVTSFVPSPRKTSDLEVTDISVVPRPSFPVLDLKFRNLGRDVAYIKDVSVQILEKNIERETRHFFAGPSTWQYNLLLDPRSNQTNYSVETSQIIPSNGTDRFTIVVGQSSGAGDIRYVDYRLRVRVLYNKDQQSEARDITLRVNSPPQLLSPAELVGPTIEERLAALDSMNPLTVAEIATVLGAIGSKEAVPKLLNLFKTQPAYYVDYYKANVLKGQLGFPPEVALRNMYISVFWALKRITGGYQESILGEMDSGFRSLAEKALEIAKQQ